LTEKVTIAGAFEMVPKRYPELDTNDLFRTVLRGAMASWPVRPEDIDGVLATPSGSIMGYDTYIHGRLVSELGLRARFVETMNLGGASHIAMVNRAAMAIREGRASAVICVSAGKMFRPGNGGGEAMARAISDPSLEMPYGTFIPAMYGMLASHFMKERGATSEDFARVAVAMRKWALLNPAARMHSAGPVTVEDILASKMIATPFHYLDCSVPSEGGGAVLVTREDLGRKWTKQPAYVLGFGEAHLRGTMSDPGDLLNNGSVVAGKAAFAEARLAPSDIKLAQLYDAFSMTPLVLLENLGICAPGEAAAFVRSGAIDPGGSFPVNTYGGLLSFGHTGDSSGMSLLTAGAMQVLGQAGASQVDDASLALVHTYGGMMFDHSTMILGREA